MLFVKWRGLTPERSRLTPERSPAGQGEGAHVDQVSRGMPAEKAGIEAGDVIAEVDGVPIASRPALTEVSNWVSNWG